MSGYKFRRILDEAEVAEFARLEETLWIAETRYDDAYIRTIMASDFIEIGRSGRVYFYDDMFFGGFSGQKIKCKLPLPDFSARIIGSEIVQTLYFSELTRNGTVERAHRSSIWREKEDGRWQIVFHQVTKL